MRSIVGRLPDRARLEENVMLGTASLSAFERPNDADGKSEEV
jgi:hypothetical protein